jgi:hypothetical protein
MVVAKATCPLYTQSATAVLSKNMAQSSGSASGCAYRNFSGGRAKKFHQMPMRACDRITKKNFLVISCFHDTSCLEKTFSA